MNGTGLRRAAFPIRLARARLAAGGERLALVAVGIVAGAAAIAAVLGGRLVMQDRALAQATAALPSSDRSLTVAWFGAYGGNWRPLDRDVTNELVGLTGREPARAMLYREASVGGRFINLRGAVDLGRYVHLESGRLPKPCTPTYCEVLRIEGTGPIPSKPTIRLVQVGRATLDPDAPFASFIQPATTGIVSAAVQYHRPQPSPVVLAEGVDGVSRTPELASFFRSYAWFLPVRPGDVHPWSVATYTKQVDDVRARAHRAIGQLRGDGAHRRARRLGRVLARRRAAAAAPRRRGRRVAPGLHRARRRSSPPRCRRVTQAAPLGRGATLAGRAPDLHRDGNGRTASARSSAGRSVLPSAAAVASAAGSPAWPVVQHALLSQRRPARRRPRIRGLGATALSDRPRAGTPARPRRDHAARRRRDRSGGRGRGRLRARLGERELARGRRHRRVRPARAGARHVRRRGRRRLGSCSRRSARSAGSAAAGRSRSGSPRCRSRAIPAEPPSRRPSSSRAWASRSSPRPTARPS